MTHVISEEDVLCLATILLYGVVNNELLLF